MRTNQLSPTFANRVSSLALVLLALMGCSREEEPEPSAPHEPSPNASILPSPLASTRPLPLADAGQAPELDAGDADVDASEPVTPTYFEADGPPSPERVPVVLDTPGVELKAQFSWQPRSAGGRGDPRGRFELLLQLADGRLRLVVESERMLLLPKTELLARIDRYGHVLLWPDGSGYRVLNPGTLRALFEELRADVSPLQDAETRSRPGGKVLGMPVQEDTVQTAMGTLVLEQAQVGGLAGSGKLLCRLLLELVLAKPDTRTCSNGRMPLKAEFGWVDGNRLGFLVTLMVRKELKALDFSIPPVDVGFRPHELPEPPPSVWATQRELGKIEPGAKAKRDPEALPEPRPPERGLVVDNRFETPRYLLVNGELVGWVPPRGRIHLKELKPGGYNLVARDFLGIEPEQRVTSDVPGHQRLGEPPTTPGKR